MEGNIFVNDISQTFFQISTQQPHRFAILSVPPIPSSTTSSSIIINWNFDNIIVKYNNLEFDFILNNEDNIKNSQLSCIIFKIDKNPNDATSNGSYIFNNTIYNVIVSVDGNKYLNIKQLLSGLFDSTIINNIFDRANSDVIGFCRITLQNGNYSRIGNLKQSFNPIGGNWIENGGVYVGYNSSLSKPYGSKVENNNGDLGIYISYTLLNDDLTLFIGIKKLN